MTCYESVEVCENSSIEEVGRCCVRCISSVCCCWLQGCGTGKACENKCIDQERLEISSLRFVAKTIPAEHSGALGKALTLGWVETRRRESVVEEPGECVMLRRCGIARVVGNCKCLCDNICAKDVPGDKFAVKWRAQWPKLCEFHCQFSELLEAEESR